MKPLLPLGRLCLFGFLSVADLVLTWILLRHGGGLIYEANPIANACLMRYGWTGLALFKLLNLELVGGVSLFLSFHRPRAGSSVLTFALRHGWRRGRLQQLPRGPALRVADLLPLIPQTVDSSTRSASEA
jgi:hypothetical protein